MGSMGKRIIRRRRRKIGEGEESGE